MGFTDDLWTALLSDEAAEIDDAVERLVQDAVASAIASETLLAPEPLDPAVPEEPEEARHRDSRGAQR